ncbi:unnamed protein product [Soboliphyme baturini]|uniref:E3 ubiquitin-protein ligase listerin n=1 Tax=Soboliphyme baturini TaxID=241478 RepID=A0A183IMP5_9BILA|nr:unnamed protein product [Soboliphyme baturini]
MLSRDRAVLEILEIDLQDQILALLDVMTMSHIAQSDIRPVCSIFVEILRWLYTEAEMQSSSEKLIICVRNQFVEYFSARGHRKNTQSLSCLLAFMLAEQNGNVYQLGLDCCRECWNMLMIHKNATFVPILCAAISDRFSAGLIRHVTQFDNTDVNVVKWFLCSLTAVVLDWDSALVNYVDIESSVRLIFQALYLIPLEQQREVLHSLQEVRTVDVQQLVLRQLCTFAQQKTGDVWDDFVEQFVKYFRNRCRFEGNIVTSFLWCFSGESGVPQDVQSRIMIELFNTFTRAVIEFRRGPERRDHDDWFFELKAISQFLEQIGPQMHKLFIMDQGSKPQQLHAVIVVVAWAIFSSFLPLISFYYDMRITIAHEYDFQQQIGSLAEVFLRNQFSELGQLSLRQIAIKQVFETIIEEVVKCANPKKCIVLADAAYSLLRLGSVNESSGNGSSTDFSVANVAWDTFISLLPTEDVWTQKLQLFNQEFMLETLSAVDDALPVIGCNTILPAHKDYSMIYGSSVFAISVYFLALIDRILKNVSDHMETLNYHQTETFLHHFAKSYPVVKDNLSAVFCTTSLFIMASRVVIQLYVSPDMRYAINHFQDSWRNVVPYFNSELIDYLLRTLLMRIKVGDTVAMFGVSLLAKLRASSSGSELTPFDMASDELVDVSSLNLRWTLRSTPLLRKLVSNCFVLLDNGDYFICSRIIAFRILEKTMPYVTDDGENVDVSGSEEFGSERPPPENFRKLLELHNAAAFPEDEDISDRIAHETGYIDSIFAYLFVWKLIIEYLSCVSEEVRARLIEHMQNTHLVAKFLCFVLRILPEDLSFGEAPNGSPFNEAIDCLCFDTQQEVQLNLHDAYSRSPPFDLRRRPNFKELIHQAFLDFFRSFQVVPAAVRQWWVDKNKAKSAKFKRFLLPYLFACLSCLSAVSRSSF